MNGVIDSMQAVVPTVRGFSPVGYNPPADLTQEEWRQAGETILLVDRFKNFAMGDWMNAGETRWGETYTQYIDEYAWGSYEKLRKLAWVARNVPHANRTPSLTWTHHHHVASLAPDEQRFWLAEASANQWTARELRDAIQEDQIPFSGSGHNYGADVPQEVEDYEQQQCCPRCGHRWP